MKKSLMIISFAFIFLLSMSIVSANFFDWLNGDAVRTAGGGDELPTRVAAGDTKPIGDYNVEIIEINEDGIVEAEVKNVRTGITQSVKLEEGETVLNGGAVLTASDIQDGSLFRRGNLKIKISDSADVVENSLCDFVEGTFTSETKKMSSIGKEKCYDCAGQTPKYQISTTPLVGCTQTLMDYCKPTTGTECTDTDGGINYTVQGTITPPVPGYSDFCVNQNILYEFYCEGGNAHYQPYFCPNGCSNGKCT